MVVVTLYMRVIEACIQCVQLFFSQRRQRKIGVIYHLYTMFTVFDSLGVAFSCIRRMDRYQPPCRPNCIFTGM